MEDSVNVLHLSDLHFGVEKMRENDSEVVIAQRNELFIKLVETINDQRKVPQEWRPDIIVISGDIAFSGHQDEYIQFEDKLLPHLRALLNPSTDDSRIIICPGNHDIILEKVRNSITGPLARPTKDDYTIPPTVPRLNHNTITDADYGRWHHFENYVVNCCENKPEELCRTVTFPEWPWLHFLVLNSAWDCQSNDDVGRLRVGLDIAQSLYYKTKVENTHDTFVAVFHHPLMSVLDQDRSGNKTVRQWLHCSETFINEAEGNPSFGSFITQRMDFVLNGHVHVQNPPVRLGRPYHFINGTLHSNDTCIYNCRIIKISRYRPPEYIDLSRRLSDRHVKWTVTAPIDPSEWDRNSWDYEYNALINKFISLASNDTERKLALSAIIDVLSKLWIEENAYTYSFNENSKGLVRILKP